MIRFTCGQCNQPVRVADSFAGKKGRCPSCKAVVHIPAHSEPEEQLDSAVADLTAALGGDDTDAEAPAPPPPPPPRPEDLPDIGGEPDLAASADPRNQTDKLQAITEGDVLVLAQEVPQAKPAAPKVPAARRKLGKKHFLIIGAAALVLIAGGIVALVFLPDGRGGSPAASVPVRPGGGHQAATAAKEKLPMVCADKACPSKGVVQYAEKDALSPDVLAGISPHECQTCKKPMAVLAVACPHCKNFYTQTLDECPYCHKPRK